MKKCTRCKQDLPLSEFRKKISAKDGLAHDCRACHSLSNQILYKRDPEKAKLNARKYRLKNPTKVKASKTDYWIRRGRNLQRVKLLKKLYGLTEEQYLKILKMQNGVCAICENPPSEKQRLAVDHKHDESRKVRGLLCGNCNHVLGKVKDNTLILQRAIDYLNRK